MDFEGIIRDFSEIQGKILGLMLFGQEHLENRPREVTLMFVL